MAKAASPNKRQTAGSKSSKRVPAPTHQDGALGAGTSSGLLVIANYVFGHQLPKEVVAAAAPFVCLGFTYLVAGARHFLGVREQRKEQKDYERAVRDLLLDQTISDAVKKQMRVELEEVRLLTIEAKRQKIIARHESIMASTGSSDSNI